MHLAQCQRPATHLLLAPSVSSWALACHAKVSCEEFSRNKVMSVHVVAAQVPTAACPPFPFQENPPNQTVKVPPQDGGMFTIEVRATWP